MRVDRLGVWAKRGPSDTGRTEHTDCAAPCDARDLATGANGDPVAAGEADRDGDRRTTVRTYTGSPSYAAAGAPCSAACPSLGTGALAGSRSTLDGDADRRPATRCVSDADPGVPRSDPVSVGLTPGVVPTFYQGAPGLTTFAAG